MIGLLGATGYTGRLVAAELGRRRLHHRLGARHEGRLAAVGAEPGAGVERAVVDVRRPAALDAFLDGLDVVLSTVGPFGAAGPAVVDAAVANGVAYVDCTAEPAFLDRVYGGHAGAPVAVVPGCGVASLPGDLLASIAAAALPGPVTAVGVHHAVSGWLPSRGAAASAVDTVAEGLLARPRRRRVAFPDHEREALEVDFAERVTVPRHLPAAAVTTTVAVPPWLVPLAAAAALRLAPVLPRVRPLVGLIPSGPPAALRRRSRVTVVAEVLGPGGRRVAWCEGDDIYALTARFLVEAATRLTAARTGALTPAQALDPAAVLDAMAGGDGPGRFAWHRP